jgi:putative transposase
VILFDTPGSAWREGRILSETIEPMPTNGVKGQTGNREDLQALAPELVERAKTEGVELIGPGGLLTNLTKTVLESALDVELTEHLGYDKHDPAGRGSGNSRNGTRSKRLLTELGPVEVDVPRDRAGTFEPVIVKKG